MDGHCALCTVHGVFVAIVVGTESCLGHRQFASNYRGVSAANQRYNSVRQNGQLVRISAEHPGEHHHLEHRRQVTLDAA